MMHLPKRIWKIVLVCTALLLVLALNTGSAGMAFTAAGGSAGASAQGMGTQPCVLSFENAGETLNGAAPAGVSAQAGCVALAAACLLLIGAYSRRIFVFKPYTVYRFTPVTLRVRLNN